MAASNLSITQGSGTRLATNSYTEGGVTVHDEKTILGEPYLAAYTIAPGGGISTATLDSHMLQIMAGASNRVRIRRIELYQQAAATTATLMGIQIMRLTTAGTGGGSQTPNPLDPADGGAGMSAMTLPTAKGTETSVMWSGAVYMMQTIAASAALASPLVVIDFDKLRSKPLTIAAGTSNGIAIKNTAAVAAGTLRVTVWADESTF